MSLAMLPEIPLHSLAFVRSFHNQDKPTVSIVFWTYIAMASIFTEFEGAWESNTFHYITASIVRASTSQLYFQGTLRRSCSCTWGLSFCTATHCPCVTLLCITPGFAEESERVLFSTVSIWLKVGTRTKCVKTFAMNWQEPFWKVLRQNLGDGWVDFQYSGGLNKQSNRRIDTNTRTSIHRLFRYV